LDSHICVGPEYKLAFFKDLYFNLSTGILLRNILKLQDGSFKVQQIYEVKNSPYIQIGLRTLK